jgi:glycosyltransferase involved in cell wall biosynthesis
MTDKVAVLHDRFPTIGGSETFAIEAARVLDAPIFTMYVSNDVDVPDDIEVYSMRQSKYTTGVSGYFLDWRNGGMNPLESASVGIDMTEGVAKLETYDILLESGPLSKYYVPTTNQRIIHYPHSPPRWLYDLFRSRMNALNYPGIGFAARVYAKLWRALDKEALDYVDTFVGNSEVIRDRIQRYYGRDAEVVYPPVTGNWRNENDEGYFVTWSRLDSEKRLDLIIEAFYDLEEHLVIAGEGEERDRLEALAAGHENIEIRGFVQDIESLVANATAVVYAPVQEDFGLVGAEAMMAGKPLLGVDEGFTTYQVETGITGLTFDPTVESLRKTVETFDPADFDSETIQQYAEQYRYEAFADDLRSIVFEV